MTGDVVERYFEGQAEQMKLTLQVMRTDPETPKPELAAMLEGLAKLEDRQGRIQDAKAHIDEALKLELEIHKDPNHVHVIQTLGYQRHVDELARSLKKPENRTLLEDLRRGRIQANDRICNQDLSGGCDLMQQVADRYRATLGDHDADYLDLLAIIAMNRLELGQNDRARALCDKLLAGTKSLESEKTPDYAAALDLLSQTYDRYSQYDEIRQILLRAKAIFDEVADPETEAEQFELLKELAQIAAATKDEKGAIGYLEAAARFATSAAQKEPLNYAANSDRYLVLAYSYLMINRSDLARPWLQKSHDLLDAVPRQFRVDDQYAWQALEAAGGYLALRVPEKAEQVKNLDRARALVRRASGIYEAIARPSPGESYVSAMGLTTMLNLFTGDSENAWKACRRGLEACAKYPGIRKDYEGQLYAMKAMCLQRQNKPREAEEAASKAADLLRQDLGIRQFFQSEGQQLALQEFHRGTLDYLLTLSDVNHSAPLAAYPSVLSWKGSVFAHQRWLRLMSQSKELNDLYTKWKNDISKLPNTGNAPAGPNLPAAPDPASSERIEKFQKELNRLTIRSTQSNPNRTVNTTVADIQCVLPPGTVLIDFLEYRRNLLPDGPLTSFAPPDCIAAFVIRRDSIARREIGPALPIHEAIRAWRTATRAEPKDDNAKQEPAAAPDPNAPPPWEKPAKFLRENLWGKLSDLVRKDETLLISADGLLATFPFAALPGAVSGTYLIEEHPIGMMPVPQLLPSLVGPAPGGQPEDRLLLVGDVNYGKPAPARRMDLALLARPDPPGVVFRASVPRSDGTVEWPELFESKGEVLTISNEFTTAYPDRPAPVPLTRLAATEQRFRTDVPKYKYVHLATHGFFKYPGAPVDDAALIPADPGITLTSGYVASRFPKGWNPGLLSGIVFAHANDPPDRNGDDGIITALELAAMDLRHVDLMVFSACATGLGTEVGGEGLLGLQRASHVAGARTVVASLWRKVRDDDARKVMERFYVNMWERKESKLGALRNAQLSILYGTEERGPSGKPVLRAGGKPYRAAPSSWAAWVLSGDWGGVPRHQAGQGQPPKQSPSR
jgi:CHAT domain-containing protein